jgi:signal transduction histidine kinase
MFRILFRSADQSVQDHLRSSLYIVTFLVIGVMVVLINWTTEVICDNYGARDFIERLQGIPAEGWRVAVLALTCFFGIVLLTMIRPLWAGQKAPQVLMSLAELLLGLGIIMALDFGYRGVLFLSFINALRFLPGRSTKFLFLALCLLSFLIADSDLISLFIPVFSLNEYINTYPESLRLWLYGLKNLLISGNEILFLIYMGWELQRWIEENTKIRDLNTQLVKTSQELAVANVRLEDYARRADDSARLRERSRMAGEIHDILGHSLMGIELGLKACLEIFSANPQRVRIQLAKMADMARTGVEEVRHVVHQMIVEEGARPTLVDSLNLLAAGIREGVGRTVSLSVEGDPVPFSPVQEEVLYRIAQESMTNAIAHGDARHIELELRFNESSFELAVLDDGVGCGNFKEGFGLRHMRERAESVDGQILFRNRDQGFLVMVTLPRSRELGAPA